MGDSHSRAEKVLRTGPFGSERLDSWKEIARYLNRDVRTVQRWEETGGLPVYRHAPGRVKGNPVYAYRSELDAWLRHNPPVVHENGSHPMLAAVRSRKNWRLVWAGLSVLLLSVGFARFWTRPAKPPAAPLVAVPLTTYPGSERSPSFSPDGNQVAFAWDGPKRDNYDIYVKLIGVEKLLRLTSDRAPDNHPAWSPDGRSIAFLRSLAGGTFGVFLIPAIGGPERKLTETGRLGAPLWSPDGRWLVIAVKNSDSPADESSSLRAVSIESGESRSLTAVRHGVVDSTGAFSPNGRNLVFSRRTRQYFSELYLLSLGGDPGPMGEPTQITFQGADAFNPSWTADGRDIIYVVVSGSASEMWRIQVNAERKPRRMEFAGDQVGGVAVSPRGNRLAYGRSLTDLNIWRLELQRSARKAGSPMPLISSTRADLAPQYSPDGSRIVFISSRSGYHEVWTCESDGSIPVQLTSMQARVTGAPHWSPDGRQIVFDSNVEGQFEVYVMDAVGGVPRRLTNHPADDAVASFSRDGRWIYFASSRTGRFEIWKMPAVGGEPVEVTRNGGWWALESTDAAHLDFAPNLYSTSLVRLSLSSGQEQVLEGPIMGASIAIAASGVYFSRPPQSDGSSPIGIYNYVTGTTTNIARPPHPVPCCLSASPDGRYLLYTQADQADSDLMLVENFR